MFDVRHTTVYSEPNTYAGWPANHGAWQWGDEFLVGFMTGPYVTGGMHNIGHPYIKLQARSHDGGETWSTEYPNVDFEGDDPDPAPYVGDDQLIWRFCGSYDTGGEMAHPDGAFYLSWNRGEHWQGPYEVAAPDIRTKLLFTSRTRYTPDGLFYLSYRDPARWGTDFVVEARWAGDHFNVENIVLQGGGRAVMPDVADLNGTRFCVMRRKFHGNNYIDVVSRPVNGGSWSKPSLVGWTGNHNGNPPALVATDDGKLVCAYANRANRHLCISVSEDGKSWYPNVLRHGLIPDIGYPQLFKRSDGQLVCVYYWADNRGECQRIEATHFKV